MLIRTLQNPAYAVEWKYVIQMKNKFEHIYIIRRVKKFGINLLILLFALLNLWNCQTDGIQNKSLIEVLPIETGSFDLVSNINSLQIIVPEKNTLLSHIKKLVTYNDYIIIKCYNRASLYFFNLDGTLDFKIDPSGSGPEEFSEIDDFAFIDEANLLISDASNHKIIHFDLKNHIVKKTFQTHEFAIYSITYYKGFIYYLTNDQRSGKIKKIDTLTGKIVDSYISEPAFVNNVVSVKPFYGDKEQHYVGLNLADTIYEISEKGLIPAFVIGNKHNIKLDSVNFNFSAFLNEFLGQNYSEKTLNMNLPFGDNTSINNFMIVPVYSPAESGNLVIFNKVTSEAIKLTVQKIPYFDAFFSFYMQLRHYDGKHAYSAFFATDKFYDDAKAYVRAYDNEISEEFKKFLTEFPEKSPPENPMILKIEFNSNFSLN